MDQPDINFTIENVNSATLAYLKTGWQSFCAVCLGVTLLWACMVASYDYLNNISLLFNWPVILPALLLSAGIYAAVIRQKMLHAFMEQFAADNGYVYQKNGSAQGLTGQFFKLGHSQSVEDYITGNFSGRPLRVFNYGYIVGSGKNQRSYKYTVMAISFSSPLPQIIMSLDHHDFGGEFLNFGFKEPVKLNLEGDFNNFFDVSVEKNFEIEALQIFKPEFMETIKQQYRSYALESEGTDLFIIAYQTITSKAELENMYAYSKFLAQTLEPVLERLKSSIAAMREAESV